LEKKYPKIKVNCQFFTLKVYCACSNNGRNAKITETVAIAIAKHPAKFGIKNL